MFVIHLIEKGGNREAKKLKRSTKTKLQLTGDQRRGGPWPGPDVEDHHDVLVGGGHGIQECELPVREVKVRLVLQDGRDQERRGCPRLNGQQKRSECKNKTEMILEQGKKLHFGAEYL